MCSQIAILDDHRSTQNDEFYVEDNKMRAVTQTFSANKSTYNRSLHQGSVSAGEITEIVKHHKRMVDKMDNDQLLSKYIEKIDRDQSDLRTDIRESEKRIIEHTSATEERINNKVDKIEQIFIRSSEKADSHYKYIVNLFVTIMIAIFTTIIAIIIGFATVNFDKSQLKQSQPTIMQPPSLIK